jgi:hypothetical protein
MVMASTKFTEGRGFPMEIAEPSSLKLVSPRATAVPGSTDPFSTGICGLIDAQPITTIAREQINRILWLLAIISVLLFVYYSHLLRKFSTAEEYSPLP